MEEEFQAGRCGRAKKVTLKCIDSLGNMPHHGEFKAKEQVLVRFASGHLTFGCVVEMNNPYKVGPKKIKYLYWRGKRYSMCRPFTGQMCTCFSTDRYRHKKRSNPVCPVHDSGFH